MTFDFARYRRRCTDALRVSASASGTAPPAIPLLRQLSEAAREGLISVSAKEYIKRLLTSGAAERVAIASKMIAQTKAAPKVWWARAMPSARFDDCALKLFASPGVCLLCAARGRVFVDGARSAARQ